MTDSIRQKLADLFLSAVNLQEGQCIFVRAEPVHWPFITLLAERAYARGAKYVHVDAQHAALYKARIDHSSAEYLPFVPEFRSKINQEYVDGKWARISISGQESPDLLTTLDSARNGAALKAIAEVDLPLRQAVQGDRIRWVVTALPTPGWAGKVFGVEPSAEASDRLWQVLEPIFRLDQEDPLQAWKSHSDAIGVRQAKLRDLDLDSLKFTGPGTDLTVGLPRGAIWLGGGSVCPDGHWFLANLPTEEVFTTPDFRRTEGTVTLTRPALILGRPVRGATFTFRGGRVVDFEAEDGKETLSEFFALDDRAAFLGEVALVDTSSPIYASGLVFHNILLDENAASHIAFGSAYPGAIPGGNEMSRDELKKAGGNSANVHSDVMIGSPDVDVTGVKSDGSEVALMRSGRWAI